MFSFFKKKTPAAPTPPLPQADPAGAAPAAGVPIAMPAALAEELAASPKAGLPAVAVAEPAAQMAPAAVPVSAPAPDSVTERTVSALPAPIPAPLPAIIPPAPSHAVSPPPEVATSPLPGAASPAATPTPERKGWLDKLKLGLRKTGSSIATVFTGTKIDEALYEELETALLLADTGVKATDYLLADLKRRVKDAKTTDPGAVKGLLADAITDLLAPLQKSLVIGEHRPTVIMVAGVNGAGKTTSIGKLTSHLASSGATVLLAAADTFRAAAREQLAIWADRNTVEIISQQGGDPAAVSFDAVSAGRARGRDVVLIDTAGRLPTQLHLMEELKKIKRTIQKAGLAEARGTAGPPQGATAPPGGSEPRETGSLGPTLPPHEVLLVIDGNTGQNALAQVKAFDEALALTGLVITKLDGTAKGGVLCAIAREKPVPVYFIGVGEKLEDLQTFNAREFAQALLS